MGAAYDGEPSIYAEPPPQPPNYIRDVDTQLNWYSPYQPVWPFGPPYVTETRDFDYTMGYNLAFNNRRGELYSFLRALAESGEGMLRVVIEARKDQLIHMPHKFQMREDAKKKDKRLDFLEDFFSFPDGINTFDDWSRMYIEDMFVIDSATLHARRKQNGQIMSIEVIDGQTIFPLVDDAGRTPQFPQPAYQQIITGGGSVQNGGAGLPMVNLDTQSLLYAPRNKRPYLPVYGFSAVEQIYLRLTELIRQEYYVLGIWDEGTIPDLVLACPENWQPGQIAEFQAFFDQLLSGQLGMRGRARFVPGGMKPVLSKGTTGDILGSLDKREERLARIICFAFSISPANFVSMMNRATAGNLQEEASQEGLYPLMQWRESVMNRIIWNWLGWKDIVFVHLPTPNLDPLKQAQAHQIYINLGVITRNEVRDQLDMPALEGGDVPTMTQGNTALPLAAVLEAKAQTGPDMMQQQHETAVASAAARPAPVISGGGQPGGQPGGNQKPGNGKKPSQNAANGGNGKGNGSANGAANGKAKAGAQPARKVMVEPEFVKVGRWIIPISSLN